MLIDSNILIYACSPGYSEVRDFIRQTDPKVSIISKVETIGYHGLRGENERLLYALFSIATVLGVTEKIVAHAIRLRQSKSMSLGDSLIAGTALVHEYDLVTRNVDDFEWIEELTVVNPLK